MDDFDTEFINIQITKMELRYSYIFEKWKLNWDKYYNYVKEKLRNKKYWIWVFLCGFEKFLKESGDIEQNRNKRLYKDADDRIYRIVGDYFQVESYVKSLD